MAVQEGQSTITQYLDSLGNVSDEEDTPMQDCYSCCQCSWYMQRNEDYNSDNFNSTPE